MEYRRRRQRGEPRVCAPMPKFHTLDDIDVRGKTVLLRADLNVPVKDGKVTDSTRIERLAPTIEALIGKGAKVVVMSHFGRPKGKPEPAPPLGRRVPRWGRRSAGRLAALPPDGAAESARGVVRRLGQGQAPL